MMMMVAIARKSSERERCSARNPWSLFALVTTRLSLQPGFEERALAFDDMVENGDAIYIIFSRQVMFLEAFQACFEAVNGILKVLYADIHLLGLALLKSQLLCPFALVNQFVNG